MSGATGGVGGGLQNSESFSSFAGDPSKLSDQELDCLKEAFSLFDADHDGEITINELGRVMRNHGLNPTNDELKDMIRNVDKNSNGAIDFNEFIEMMVRRDAKVEEDVMHAFRVFDRDGDGYISVEELRLTMNNLGEPLTDQEVRSMIEEADLDGDGRINFQEFARLMQTQQQQEHRSGSMSTPPSSTSSSGGGGPGGTTSHSKHNGAKCL